LFGLDIPGALFNRHHAVFQAPLARAFIFGHDPVVQAFTIKQDDGIGRGRVVNARMIRCSLIAWCSLKKV
jgi:hypothetical protein